MKECAERSYVQNFVKSDWGNSVESEVENYVE